MELLYAAGLDLVAEMKDRGHDVFCDLKLHDIPNTVRGAARSLSALGADLLTVHAAGGSAMMRAAREGIQDCVNPPAILAITQLTSTSEESMHNEQLVQASLPESVKNYAKLAESAQLNGVVCSALEAQMLRKVVSPNFLLITPGIRLDNNSHDDQARVTTPQLAAQYGASGIVVGRPVTKADDPLAAYHEILNAWQKGK